jgi:hypothetical protein
MRGVAGYRDRWGSGIEIADLFPRTPLPRCPPYPVPMTVGSNRDESFNSRLKTKILQSIYLSSYLACTFHVSSCSFLVSSSSTTRNPKLETCNLKHFTRYASRSLDRPICTNRHETARLCPLSSRRSSPPHHHPIHSPMQALTTGKGGILRTGLVVSR